MRKTPALYLLLPGLAVAANAEVCTDIGDDERRLACFDAGRECAAIDDAAARLECYDALYLSAAAGEQAPAPKSMDSPAPAPGSAPAASSGAPASPAAPAAPATPAAPASAAADDAPPAPEPTPDPQTEAAADPRSDAEADFGLKTPDPEKEIRSIRAEVVGVQTTGLGIDYLQLDNGQVWRELEDSRIRFREGDVVVITKGVLGSFNLSPEDSGRQVKVRRMN